MAERILNLMRAMGWGLLALVQALLTLLLVLYLLFKGFEREHFRQVLPVELEPAGLVLIDGISGLREGCGVVVWRLGEASASGLRREGLAYLRGARQARGHDDVYYRYGPWQATPLPAAQNAEGWLPLGCADAESALQARILRAAQEPGGYYSEKPEGVLLVLPAERLIVFGYDG